MISIQILKGAVYYIYVLAQPISHFLVLFSKPYALSGCISTDYHKLMLKARCKNDSGSCNLVPLNFLLKNRSGIKVWFSYSRKMPFSGYVMHPSHKEDRLSLALNTPQSPVSEWEGVLKKCRLNWNIVLRGKKKKSVTAEKRCTSISFPDWKFTSWGLKIRTMKNKRKWTHWHSSVPSFNKFIPSCFPSCEWPGSREVWERLTSAESWSRLWKLFL